jgi:hypothetical protein
MKNVRLLLTYAVSQVRARGGWIIVTLQDGSVVSLGPNVRLFDNQFAATDTHGHMVSYLYEHVTDVRVGAEPEVGTPA